MCFSWSDRIIGGQAVPLDQLVCGVGPILPHQFRAPRGYCSTARTDGFTVRVRVWWLLRV
jgi:hypothetical protein